MKMINYLSTYIGQYVDAAYLLQFFCVSLCMIISLCPREDNDKTNSRYFIKTMLRTFAVFFLMLFCNYIFSMLADDGYMLPGIGTWICYLLGTAVVAIFFCDYNTNARIITASAVYSMSVLVIELGDTFGALIASLVDGADSLYFKMIANILVVLAATIIRRHPVYPYDISGFTVYMNMVCAGLSSFFVVFYDMIRILRMKLEWNDNYQLLLSVVFLLFYIMNAVNYLMAVSLCREQSDVLLLRTKVQMEQNASELMVLSEHNLKELRKIRHDIDNQNAYMKTLLKEEKYQELQDYFTELSGTFREAIVPYVDCGNGVLNTILNMEYAKAKERKVTLDIRAAVPKELPYSDVDLCKMLSNLIDNAIEAVEAEKIKEPINVVLKISGEYFYVSVKNGTKKSAGILSKKRSTKPDPINHGYGLEIVTQVAEKYKGMFNRKIENGYFVAEVVLLYNQEATVETMGNTNV